MISMSNTQIQLLCADDMQRVHQAYLDLVQIVKRAVETPISTHTNPQSEFVRRDV